MNCRAVVIDYTNWLGKREKRRILPSVIFFGQKEWHTKSQWFLTATDIDNGVMRVFALKDIHSWEPDTDRDRDGRAG